MSSQAVYRSVTASKPPPRRITLGYAAIAAAREVWVLASGAGKEAALRESLSPDGTTPLARVLRGRERTCIFTDLSGYGSSTMLITFIFRVHTIEHLQTEVRCKFSSVSQ